jgi:catechol-2,3-dioxygenase
MSAQNQDRPVPPNAIPLRFSHVGFFVHDLPAMERFYTEVLGFTVTDRGKVRGSDIVFTSWDPVEHHQVALVAGRPDHLAFNHINQLSFRGDTLEDLQVVWRRVKDEPGVSELRPINHGNAWALYFRDPEGNRIEIFCDSAWYIDQPCVEELDLSRTPDDIRCESEQFCRSSPGFKPVADFQAEIAERIRRHHAAE